MDSNEIQKLALKVIKIASFLTGVAFTAYNLSSFKVDKFGYFFNDDNQIWLAFGLTNLAVYYLVKNWKNL
jgi:hypothetical protein